MEAAAASTATFTKKQRLLAFTVLVLACVLGGPNAVLVKMSSVGSIAFAFWTNLIILPFYAVGAAFEIRHYRLKKSHQSTPVSPHRFSHISSRSLCFPRSKTSLIGIGWAVATGFSAALATALYYTSISTSSLVAIANFLHSLAILFVPLFSIYCLSERLQLTFYAGAILAVVGVILLVCGNSFLTGSLSLNFLSDLQAFLSAVGFALGTIFLKKSTAYMGPLTALFLLTTSALLVYLLVGPFLDPTFTTLPPTVREWVIILVSVVFQTLPHVGVATALRYLSASLCGVTSAVQNLSSSIFAYLILGETLSYIQLAGFVTGLVGVAVSTSSNNELCATCCRIRKNNTITFEPSLDAYPESFLLDGGVRSTDPEAPT